MLKVSHILFLLSVIFCSLPTDLFIYDSLSQTLIPSIYILTLGLWSFGSIVKSKVQLHFNIIETIAFVWISYLLFHGMIVSPEWYKLRYIVVSLSFIPILASLIRNTFISIQFIENCFLLMAFLHIIYIVLQTYNVIEPGDSMYSITGTNANPSSTAIFLVGCLAMTMNRMFNNKKRKSWIYTFLTIAIIICIIVLKCRTAYIGMTIVAFINILPKLKNYYTRVKYKWLVISSVIFFMGIIIACGYGMYHMKKDSADGRLLIWKLSSDMILQHPEGYGYGMYEKEYNQRQAGYFLSGSGTEREKDNADYITLAYNDYLEQGVEGGVIGMLLLITFYVILIFFACRQGNMSLLGIFVSYAVMSLTNFVYISTQAWLLLICCVALLCKDGKPVPKKLDVPLKTITSISFVFLLIIEIQVTSAQMQLKDFEQMINRHIYVNEKAINNLQSAIGTSEGFWRISAKNHILHKNYNKAKSDLKNALLYSSAPSLLRQMYQINDLSGKDEALTYLLQWYGMQPHHLKPKYFLMEYYAHREDNATATKYAKEIVTANVKIKNKKSDYIQQKAYEYLCNK